MNSNNKYYLFFLICISLGFFGCEEDPFIPEEFGTLFGEVLMAEENIAIASVTISTNPPTSSVETDAEGRFQLENIPEGTYSLRAEKSGFLTEVTSVAVFANSDANVIIRMNSDSLENNPPSIPMNITPINGSIDNEVNVTLSWTSTDIDAEDQLSYDLLLFNSDQTEVTELLINSVDSTYELTNLDFNTNYYWQVIVYDGFNDPVFSEVWNFRTVAFPDYRFVYTKKTDSKYNIFSSDETGNFVQLTDNDGSNWRPRMNPQRNKIAYISNVDVNPQIYIMDRDGTNKQRVTNVPISGAIDQFDLDFSWSPDGSRILYPAGSKLYSILLDGTGLTEMLEAPLGITFAECDWTEQDNRIVARTVGATPYISTMILFNVDPNSWWTYFSNIPGRTGGPSFSIDGNDALYTHDISGFEAVDGRQLDAHIFIRDLGSSNAQDISIYKPNGTNDLDPRYSPDGSKIIFTNTNNDGISQKNIWIMDLDGENRTLLFEDAEMPEWK